MLPTNKDDCSGLSVNALAIASNREKGMPLQRLRTLFIEGFARDDRSSSTTFSPFDRATILGWLSKDLYGPSAFLSSSQAMRAADIWCHTAITTAHPERIRFTLAFLTPDLIHAISACTAGVSLGPTLIRLRDHGLPLEDAVKVLREGIVQGVIVSSSKAPFPRNEDSFKSIERTRHEIAENVRVLGSVAAAIYADRSLTETTSIEQVTRFCLEVWMP